MKEKEIIDRYMSLLALIMTISTAIKEGGSVPEDIWDKLSESGFVTLCNVTGYSPEYCSDRLAMFSDAATEVLEMVCAQGQATNRTLN